MSILTRENDRKGILGTVLFHVILFLIMLITGFGSVKPLESDNGGVTVSFGEPDQGGDDSRPMSSEVVNPPPPSSSTPEESVVTTNDDAPEVEESVKPVKKPVVKPTPETKPTETPETKPSIDPRLKAQLDKMKKAKENPGGGTGDGTKPGDQGQPDGDQNGDPNGTGKGTLGNGISYNLKGFSVSGSPQIRNDKQSFGTVVVKVCVNKFGKIVSTTLGQGSTTTDNYLYEISEKAVRQLSISPTGSVTDTNCGTVTFKFERQ